MTRLSEALEALDQARAERTKPAPSLFDPPAPYLATVEANASAQWIEHALDAVRLAAAARFELTTEDVWPYITEPVHDPRAIGAVMRRAARAGIIRGTGAYVQSTDPKAHSRPLTVWRSAIHNEGNTR